MTSIPRALAAAISATLVEPQSTVTMTVQPPAAAASIAASDRPWPSSSRLGTYGSTATPNRRRARVMIASPVRPSASKSPKTRTRSPRSRARRQAGQQPGRHRAAAPDRGGRRAARRTRPRSRRPTRSPRVARMPGHPGRDAVGLRRHRRPSGMGVTASRKVQRKRGSTTASGCHGGLHRGSTGPRSSAASGRRAPDARCCASRSAGRDGGRPTAASRRAAGEATKIDEYVPETMPMSSARTKSWIAAPPNRSSARSVMHHGQAGHDRAAEGLQDRVVDDVRRTARRRGAPCSRGSGRRRRSCRAR